MIEISHKQEEELKQLHEAPSLVKLELSKYFPRATMHSRKNALGLGLIKPKTVIVIKKLQLHAGSMRILGNAGLLVHIQEQYLQVEAGRPIELGEDPKHRY